MCVSSVILFCRYLKRENGRSGAFGRLSTVKATENGFPILGRKRYSECLYYQLKITFRIWDHFACIINFPDVRLCDVVNDKIFYWETEKPPHYVILSAQV